MKHDQNLTSALYRTDLCAFAERAHMIVEPSTKLQMNWHHDAIAYQLMRARRREIRQLIVNQPPKTLKTYLISVAFVAHTLGINPDTKFMIVSYDEELAIRQARTIRMIMRDPWYKKLFPCTRIGDKDLEHYFETTGGGEVRAVAITGGITGYGYDFIILDDIMKADGARSERIRRDTEEIFSSTIANRWREPGKGVLINVQQRLHVEDFTTYLLKTYKNAFHLNIPAESPEDTYYDIGDDVKHLFGKGELLHDERLSKAYLEEMRAVQGRVYYTAQYLQDPQLTGGRVVDPKWFRPLEEPRRHDVRVLSIDPAFTENDGDYSAALVMNLVRDEVEIIHGERVQVGAPDLIRWVKLLNKHWEPDIIVFEAIGAGRGIAQLLRREGLSHLEMVELHGSNSKLRRMEVISPMIEAGHVWLPSNGAFVEPFLKEIAQFPYGKTDDWADSLSQVLVYLDNVRRHGLQHKRRREPAPPEPSPPVRPWSPHYRRWDV